MSNRRQAVALIRTLVAGAATLAVAVALVPATRPASTPLAELTSSGTTTVNVEAPDIVRADRLAGVSVSFTGIDAKTKVRVNWGDGSPTQVRKGPCSVKGARSQPQGCTVTFT
ncbi:MAG: hypothetical protein ACKOW5_16890, partial [Actinomycetales bacterium]